MPNHDLSVVSPELSVELHDPASLAPAPWNPNRLEAHAEQKLEASIMRLGLFKPIICRQLADGTLQILGGHFRAQAAIRVGMKQVPVVNLGHVSDDKAREITVIDNGRYGRDDAGALSEMLKDMGASTTDLATFLPFDMGELEAITKATEIDLDTLGLSAEDEAPVERAAKAAKTESMMRFKVPIEDERRISEILTAVMKSQGFTHSDQLTNAGDALVWIVDAWANAQDDGE